jgi:hypothetical protein
MRCILMVALLLTSSSCSPRISSYPDEFGLANGECFVLETPIETVKCQNIGWFTGADAILSFPVLMECDNNKRYFNPVNFTIETCN